MSKRFLPLFVCIGLLPVFLFGVERTTSAAPGTSAAADSLSAPGQYIGSAGCQSCHEKEYTQFQKHSKKAHSRDRIELMASKLTADELQGCYQCHTTGYGKGGFTSYNATPHLADVGCESCHGPGKAHAEAGDPALIRVPTQEDCASCHTNSRMAGFSKTVLMYSGAH